MMKLKTATHLIKFYEILEIEGATEKFSKLGLILRHFAVIDRRSDRS